MSSGGAKLIDEARGWLIDQIPKYAEVLVSKKATLPKKKNAQRELAEIYAATQALELGRRAATPPVRQADTAFPTFKPSPNPEEL